MKKITANRIMLHIQFLLITLLIFTGACAQKSPPAVAEKAVDGVNIKINYNSPRVRDRIIWGDLVAYDKIWRTGANEATVLEVSKDVRIDGKKVPAGQYALFTIPKKGEPWTVILNKVAEQWGAYKYDEGQDLMRFSVDTKRVIDLKEEMTFDIDDAGNVIFTWEYLSFQFEVDTK
jgi:hypothetical protein